MKHLWKYWKDGDRRGLPIKQVGMGVSVCFIRAKFSSQSSVLPSRSWYLQVVKVRKHDLTIFPLVSKTTQECGHLLYVRKVIIDLVYKKHNLHKFIKVGAKP